MKKKLFPYLLLTPMILIMGVLVFYPIITTFSYSLKKWKLTAPGDIRFIGFKNYTDIIQSDSSAEHDFHFSNCCYLYYSFRLAGCLFFKH